MTNWLIYIVKIIRCRTSHCGYKPEDFNMIVSIAVAVIGQWLMHIAEICSLQTELCRYKPTFTEWASFNSEALKLIAKHIQEGCTDWTNHRMKICLQTQYWNTNWALLRLGAPSCPWAIPEYLHSWSWLGDMVAHWLACSTASQLLWVQFKLKNWHRVPDWLILNWVPKNGPGK